jgi:hypothetical protein
MTRTIRYTIEMHPEAVDAGKPVPNAWRCEGFDERDKRVTCWVDNTPQQALQRAIQPATVMLRSPPTRDTLIGELRRAACVLLLRLVGRLWPLRTMNDARVYRAITDLAQEMGR